MKRAVESLDRALSLSPAQFVFRMRAARKLVVLAYHDIADRTRFHQQMEHVGRTATVISADELCRSFRGEAVLPLGATLLTFDDGDRSIFEIGQPILEQFGFPAVAFVIPGLLDSDHPFWWAEVEDLWRHGGRVAAAELSSGDDCVRWLKTLPNADRLAALEEMRRSAVGAAGRVTQLTSAEIQKMASAGIEIGNHTLSHPCLNRCDPETVEWEIREAHILLERTLGLPPRLFAYPSGYDHPRVPSVLEDLRYEAAFLFDHRIGAFPPADRYAISRVRVNSTTSIERFKTILSGLHPFLHHVRGGR